MAWSTRRFAVQALVWGSCMVGALSLSTLPDNQKHSICGPWGCGPPLPALLACHLAWLVALIPVVYGLIRSPRFSEHTVKSMGRTAIGISVVGLIVVLVHQLVVWYPAASQFQRPYFWHRYGFMIVTLVDLPILQVLVSGVGTFMAGYLRGVRPGEQLNRMPMANREIADVTTTRAELHS